MNCPACGLALSDCRCTPADRFAFHKGERMARQLAQDAHAERRRYERRRWLTHTLVPYLGMVALACVLSWLVVYGLSFLDG